MNNIKAHSPPYSENAGVMIDQPGHEVWARSGDQVGTIADHVIRRLGRYPFVDVACIGAGAINQALKGIAVARKEHLQTGGELVVVPFFSMIEDDKGRERTRMVFRVFLV
jgi:stage V sporulation protein SpoVS